jgi:predicted O-methyltransferase YrrM
VNAERRAITREVFAAGRAYDARQSDRLGRLRNLEPEPAELLSVIVRATRTRRVLEIGTSNGYSTLWLADAVEATGEAARPARPLSRRGRAAEAIAARRPPPARR